MKEGKLKVLVIDRLLKQSEQPVRDIFFAYHGKFDMIIFPLDEGKNCTEVVFYNSKILNTLEELFFIKIYPDEDLGFYDFDLQDIDEQTFYDILDQRFEVESSKLTAVETMPQKIHSILNNPLDETWGIGTSKYCPDCGGICGNSNHNRRW